MVDARDEGELGASASMMREGGRRREKSPRCLRSGRGFYEDGKDFMEGGLGSQPESLKSTPSLSGCGPGTAAACPAADTLQEETRVQGRF